MTPSPIVDNVEVGLLLPFDSNYGEYDDTWLPVCLKQWLTGGNEETKYTRDSLLGSIFASLRNQSLPKVT